MSRLAWIYRDDWTGRWPSIGGDEFWRRTLVLPWPFSKRHFEDNPDDDIVYKALVVVVTPWWATRHVLNAEFRAYAKWTRALNTVLYALPDDVSDEVFDAVLDAMYDKQPPFPKVFE